MPWIEDRIGVVWLEANDDRLDMTRFEEGSAELNRRRRLRLDPGKVTIGLHPALLEDENLYRHTFVHEFLHAAGHPPHSFADELTNKVAPTPKMSESPLLQRLRDSVLGDLKVKSWSANTAATRGIERRLKAITLSQMYSSTLMSYTQSSEEILFGLVGRIVWLDITLAF